MNRYGMGGLIQYKSVIEPRCRDLTTLIEAVDKDTVKGSYVRLPAKGHDCFIEALFMENGQIISDYEKVTPSSRILSKGISTKNGAKFFDFDRLMTNGKTIPLNSWYYVPLTNRELTYTFVTDLPVRFSDLREVYINVSITMHLTLKTCNSNVLLEKAANGHTVRTEYLITELKHELSRLKRIAQEAAREFKFDAFVANTDIYESYMRLCFRKLEEEYGLKVKGSSFDINYNNDDFERCQSELFRVNRMPNELDRVTEYFKDPAKAVQAISVYKMSESDYRFTPTEVHSAIKNLK